VLRRLLVARREAFMVWDHDLNPIWISPGMHTWLQNGIQRDELNGVAALAFRRLRSHVAPLQRSSVTALLRLSSASNKAMLAKFSCIDTEDGHRWLTAELSRSGTVHAKLGTVTRAERNVLRLLLRGLSNREIGQVLCVSTETVRTHVRRLLEKLEVSSRAKAANVVREAWPEFEDCELDWKCDNQHDQSG
jgi:ATP/maltotriose-dependent transcriptional regulator MalT